jgi:small-conductance mechanosensitive channel
VSFVRIRARYYFVIFISILTGLQLFGFNLSVLVAGSAALLVGVRIGVTKFI